MSNHIKKIHAFVELCQEIFHKVERPGMTNAAEPLTIMNISVKV